MTTKFKTLALALSVTTISFAQVGLPSGDQLKTSTNQLQTTAAAAPTIPAAKQGLGSMIGQLTNNISPSSLTDAFAKEKPSFVNKANATSTPAASASLLQTLAGGLKPSSFTSDWPATKTKWMAAAKSATTQKQVAGLLGQLASKIDPSKFKGEWSKLAPAWEAGVKKLSN